MCPRIGFEDDERSQSKMTKTKWRMTKAFPNDEAGFGTFVIRASWLIRHSTFMLRHLPKTLRPSDRLCGDRDGTFSRPCAWRESPQPNAEESCNDQRDPAYSHRDLMTADLHRDLFDQSVHMTKREETKKDARDA